MQNIGAYGAELKDTLLNVEAYQFETGEKRIFSKEDCELSYRDSVFKNKLKGKYFISALTLKLSKKEKKNINYKILKKHLEKNKIEVRNPNHVSEAVSEIRRSKLPNPKIVGNAGSFFKNVFLEKAQLQALQKNYPEIPYFEELASVQATTGKVKIPAGWLVEQCGWKGYRSGNIGVSKKQALVLVNYGGATGLEIIELANKIVLSVKEKFDLILIPEVNLI